MGIALALLFLSAALLAAPTSRAFARAVRAAPLTAHSVLANVTDVTPSTPPSSDKPVELRVTLSLENTTDQSLPHLTIDAVRATPIDNQQSLDAALAAPQAPDPQLSARIEPKGGRAVAASLGPRASTTVQFVTTTEIPTEAGLCLCHNAIYPLYFTVHTVDQGGSDIVVGSTQTYVPSFATPADIHRVRVSWVWPVLDRPHRLVEATGGQPPVFVDDDLASSVSGGRLDRVLSVLELVAGKVPITVMLDPEIIDELAVMATGPYRVGTGDRTSAGVGSSAARDWLTRLRVVLAQPHVYPAFTAFADPDVESLTRNGLTWVQSLGQAAQNRVTAALGGVSPTDTIAWPADGAAGPDTVEALARQGATTLVLSDTAVRLPDTSPPPNGMTSMQTASGRVAVAVTSSAVQRWVNPTLNLSCSGTSTLPQFVAEVAMRAVASSTTDAPGYVPIVPTRDINPCPTVAARAILDTARTSWSVGIGVGSAAQTVTPVDHAPLTPPQSGAGLSPVTVAAAQSLSHAVPALTTMLSAKDADLLLGPLPAAVQRAESSAWRDNPAGGDAFAQLIGGRVDALESGVTIVKPKNGTYTLASNNSPLPVTISNNLDVPVTVRISIVPVNGLPGFKATDIGLRQIGPKQLIPLHIPTEVQRTGRFQVQAVLWTPSGDMIGGPVLLTVRSTALGLVGVVITVVAAAVLVLALLLRVARRLRRRAVPRPDVRPMELV